MLVLVRRARDRDRAVLLRDRHRRGQRARELALRALHRDDVAVLDRDRDAVRHGDRAFPIRDMCVASLPDEGEELAAGARLTRLTVGHQPLRRAQDRDAEAVAHARDLGDADVLAQAGRRHALQLRG